MSDQPEEAKQSATWIVTAKWAHPSWDQYIIILLDLDSIDNPPPHRHRQGDTHELLVFALNPDKPNASNLKPRQNGVEGLKVEMLHPANHGYQFKAASHEEAVARVQAVVDAVHRRQLSPDTDWRTVWNLVFWDGFQMVRSAFSEGVEP